MDEKDDYTLRDVMEAVIEVRDAAAISTTRLEAKIDNLETKLDTKIDSEIGSLRREMNRRFDRVDVRFDEVNGRLTALEAPRRRPKNRE
jgi:hypothetical protein